MPQIARQFRKFARVVPVLLIASFISQAQSTDQNFPTPVRTNEISGVVKARDVGDARVTSHFYTFEGAQGDLFVNVQTANFTGDVDVYAMPGLRPLTKMVLYADSTVSETGRVIYLRKPETILLRIEGRSPGDDDASYRIKFAGGFVASKAQDFVLETPKVSEAMQSNVRVNSVGTIIEVIPKPTPAPVEPERSRTGAVAKTGQNVEPVAGSVEKVSEPAETPSPKNEVVVTDPLAETEKEAKGKTPPKRTVGSRRSRPIKPAEKPKIDVPAETDIAKEAGRSSENTRSKSNARAKKAKAPAEPDPMANVRLVIRFKDGSTIERPMTEVFKFTVERAVLTVISKDGSIGRYQMVDVAGVTIE